MTLSPALVEQMRTEIYGAVYGHKTAVVGRYAQLLGMSVSQVYAITGYDSHKTRKAAPLRPEYRAWTFIIFQIKKRPPEEAGEISTDQAVRIAVNSGLIPAVALSVPVETFDRIGREMKLNQKKVRRNRFQASRPNKVHHFDASTSKFFYIKKRMPDGDYVLRMHRPAKHYKNKPIPVDALRPWVYGLTDDNSGRHLARYTAAQGESMIDSLSFLGYAWSVAGLPAELWADQGMLKRGLASQDLIMRLGVELPDFDPYEKYTHGKIERPWRTQWQRYEKQYFAVDDWQKFEITLSEFNRRFDIYLEEYNAMAHRFEPDITRMQAWNRVNLYGGIVALPENALATVAKRKKRKVDVDGTIEYEGVTYEVKGLHAAWVYVYEGIFEDRLVVEEIETGNKFEVCNFKPLDTGEFRAHPETAHQKAVKESANLNITPDALLYAEKKPSTEKITPMPTRVKEERELADPMNVTAYGSIAEAMAELAGIVGTVIPADQRAEIERLIKVTALDKGFVNDLALELRAAIEVRRVANGL